MIDIGIYKQLHPAPTNATTEQTNNNVIDPSAMASDEPPPGVFTLLLPNVIIGFNMQEKKWGRIMPMTTFITNVSLVNLEVSRIRPVKWNKMVFESLVVDPDIKLLIKALVTNQIAAEQSTDLMNGKGNGLIVLLHG